MKFFFLSLICSLTFSVMCIAQITGNQRFDATDFTISDTVGADQITYSFVQSATLYHAGSAGAPQLPVQYKNWLIPYGAVIDSIAITDNSYIEISLQHNIFPVQPDIPAGLMPPPSFQGIDTNIYFSDLPYPVQLIQASGNGYWHNANIATIAIYPYKYFPSDSLLKFYSSLSYTIYYSFPHGQISPDTLRADNDNLRAYKQQLGGMIENDTDIDSFLENILITSSYKKNIGNLPIADYIVIVPDATFKASQALNDFIFWKQKRGINIAVVTKEEIHNQYNGQVDAIGNIVYNNNNSIGGPAAEIRLYLYDVWEELGINFKYILLVGDENKMPVRNYFAVHNNYYNTIPSNVITDKYYADYNSDYNVDGDIYFGEITPSSTSTEGDKVDLYPELYVGRIPCSNINEFSIWIDKLISYETNPGNGDASYLKGFVMTMADGPQNSIGQLTYNNLNIFDPLTVFKELPTYNHPDPETTDGEAIISYLNTSSSGWWTWDNHGSANSFKTRSKGENGLAISSISCYNTPKGLLSLHNENKYGIVSSNCCDVANFGANDNMLDALLFNSNGGSVAMAGNTDLGWYPTGQYKLNSLTSVIRGCHLGANQTNTRYCSADWGWYIGKSPYAYAYYETYLTNNYFGDPEMMYYTKEPPRIVGKISPRHITKSNDNSINLTVNNLAFGTKAVVGMYQEPTLAFPNGYKRIKEITGGHDIFSDTLHFPPDRLTEGKLYITISGFNYLPFTDEILVSPGCTFVNNVENITTSQTWSGQRFKDHTVKVKSPATLTITGEVYFVPQAKLIVEQGAKLVLHGGTLGTSCENLWQGVEVWGTTSQKQTVTYQGSISVTNGGSIQDAFCAIRTCKINGSTVDNTTHGGIIHCNNAIFINNECSIRIYPFTMNAYNATIAGSLFSIDNNNLINNTLSTTNMIYLDGMAGLLIHNCNFINNVSSQNTTSLQRGNGLYVRNSAVTVGGNVSNGCSFSGLTYGIKGENSNGVLVPLSISYSTFENNLRGVMLSGYTISTIVKNSFKTIIAPTNLTASSGLYLNACTGYSVQENTFEGNFGGTVNTYETGIVINNSGTAPNEIYNNTFTKLQNGITAQDNNLGLVCKCNDYAGVKTDQSVLITGGSSNTIGIALYQGDGLSVSGPAGNTFSLRTSGTGDIYNEGVKFNYYHHQNTMNFRLKPEYYEKVDLIPYNYENYTKQAACPSKLGGGGGINQEQIKDELASAAIQIEQKKDSLVALIDGGNTEETTEDVVYSSPQEALDLRDTLLDKSPYLSDTVMQSVAANEYVLPNAMVRDILVANPQSATSDPVLDELDKRVDPMPDEMYNQILDGELMLSPKETKEAELASLKLARETNYNTLVSYYLADSTGMLNDSLDQLLISENKPEPKYMLACKQLSEGDLLAATNTLAAIPATFKLSPDEMTRHDNYLSYFAIVGSMEADTLPDSECDSLQLVALTLLMQEGCEPISSYARNLLIANGAITYNEPYLVADELKSARVKRERRSLTTYSAPILTLCPNPCRNFVIAGYSLEDKLASDAFLTISTLQGVEIKTIQLLGAKDQVVISLNNFNPGVYVASLKAGGKLMDSKKIIIVK